MLNPIIEKLQKLIAHEKSAKAIGSLSEAEAFATRIQELLSKHKLSLSDVQGKVEEQAGLGFTVVRVTDWMAETKRAKIWEQSTELRNWVWRLAWGIARANDCAVVLYGVVNVFQFIGVDADRLPVVELFKYMAALAWELSEKSAKEKKEEFRTLIELIDGVCKAGKLNAATKAYRASYLLGFADAIVVRLYAERAKMLTEAKETKNENALVLVDRRLVLIENHMTKHVSQDVNTKFRNDGASQDGYNQGFVAGSKVALTSKVLR